MFKLVTFLLLVGVSLGTVSGSGGYGNYVSNYGYNIHGGGHHGAYGHGHGGYGQAHVKVHQTPYAYNYGVQTRAHGGNSYIHQSGNVHYGHGYGHGAGGYGYH